MAITMTPNSAKALPGAALVSCSERGAALKTVESEALSTRTLFELYAGFVMRTVRRLGVRPSDTEDVTQEIFMTAHRRIADRHTDVHPRSWLFGIARRVVANYLRKAHRLRPEAG